jgi:hypothetical protein
VFHVEHAKGDRNMQTGPIVYNLDTTPSPSLRAKIGAEKIRVSAAGQFGKGSNVLKFDIGNQPGSDPSADQSGDPVGKFLDYDFGGGVKMKFALPVFLLALAALCSKGGRR